MPSPLPDTAPEFKGKSRSLILSIALVAGFAELSYAMMNISAMPVYLKFSMGYGETMVTAIGAAFLLCEGLMKGPFGILGDRIGRKRLIIVGPSIRVVTALLTLVVRPPEWYFFVLLRVLDGLGAAALWPAALAMMADVVREQRRSQAMALFNVTYLVGVALGPAVGGAANDLTAIIMERIPRYLAQHTPNAVARHVPVTQVDPRQASFYVISFLFLLTTLLAWWRVPAVPPHHQREGADPADRVTLATLLRTLRASPGVLLMAFVTFFGVGLVMFLVKLFAMDELDLSETVFGTLLLIPCLLIALVSVPLGTIGDKLGRARAVRIGLGLCAFAMWGLILVPAHWSMIVGGTIIGVGFVIAFPSWMAYVTETCEPHSRGAIVGAVGTAQGAGALLGVPIGGYLYERVALKIPAMPWLNGHYLPFIGCATMLLIGWLLAMTIIRTDVRALSGSA